MGTIWGLVTAIAWGFTDFLIKPASMRLGDIRAAFFVELFSLILLGGYFLVAGERLRLEEILPFAGMALLAAIVNFLATWSLFRAYRIGELTLMAPVVSAYNVITVLLALVILMERPSLRQGAGMVLTFAGIIILSTSWSELKNNGSAFTTPGARWALLSAVCFGLAFFLVDYVVDDMGPVTPVIVFKIVGVFGFLSLRYATKIKFNFPKSNIWLLLGALVFVDTLGGH
jgi:drug/metabolite transporter (DMT)-like permease